MLLVEIKSMPLF